jgi:hypothetical protein
VLKEGRARFPASAEIGELLAALEGG